MQNVKELLEQKIKERALDKKKEKKSGIHAEFQDFAYRLAHKMGDLEHKGIYFRVVKAYPRALVQDAASFALTYTHVANKGKLFMWRLKELYREYKEKHPDHKLNQKKRSPKKKKKEATRAKKSKKKKSQNYKLFE